MIPTDIPDDDAMELVELLWFVEDLCTAQAGAVSAALFDFAGAGYDAAELGADAARLAAVVAGAVGVCPHPHVFADMDCDRHVPGDPPRAGGGVEGGLR